MLMSPRFTKAAFLFMLSAMAVLPQAGRAQKAKPDKQRSALVSSSSKARLQKKLRMHKPGLHACRFVSSEKEREFLLHIPRGYKKSQKKTVPLVVMLHGRTGSGKGAAASYYGWRALADRERFVALFPTALGNPTSWKGAWCGTPTEDSKFLAALIRAVREELRIDPQRVFMTGHSSGGFMSYSFAVTHSDLVAAVAPVAALLVGRARPERPVSVIAFHGTSDEVVPYEGRAGGLGAVKSAASIAKANGCGDPARVTQSKGKVHVDTWTAGRDGTDVVLYSIEGFGHGWPQPGTVATTKLIWRFFETHGRGPKSKKRSKTSRNATKK